MRADELAVDGAVSFTPAVFPDERGLFVSPFQASVFEAAVGRPLFPIAQVSYSQSRRGVVRGLHYTVTPPGVAKYVYCPLGRVVDVVFDTRVGSPTFGKWDSVILDDRDRRSVYFPVGVAHMFVALEDRTVVTYQLSREYQPRNELALSPLDVRLGLPIPDDIVPILSERDREAPTLDQAQASGLLPVYDVCRELEKGRHRPLTAE